MQLEQFQYCELLCTYIVSMSIINLVDLLLYRATHLTSVTIRPDSTRSTTMNQAEYAEVDEAHCQIY
jgi:hypothetical protein